MAAPVPAIGVPVRVGIGQVMGRRAAALSKQTLGKRLS